MVHNRHEGLFELKVDSLTLADGEVHIWQVSHGIFEEDHDFAEYLSDSEIEQQTRLGGLGARRHFAIRCAALRVILSCYCTTAPQSWRFDFAAQGRPGVASVRGIRCPLVFNVSHTEGLTIIGVTRQCCLGIDVERIHARFDLSGIAHRFFAPAEVQDLDVYLSEQPCLRFFEYWTLKEAYTKATGDGLTQPLNDMVFDLSTPGRVGFTVKNPGPNDRPKQFFQYRLPGGLVLSICTEGLVHPESRHRFRVLTTLSSAKPLSVNAWREPVRGDDKLR